jgi:hypothetical protein
MTGMQKYGESKTTRIMIATVRHVTSGSGLTATQYTHKKSIAHSDYGHHGKQVAAANELK